MLPRRWTSGGDWRALTPPGCAACREALRAGAAELASLAAGSQGAHRNQGLCLRHVRCLLAVVPDADRAGAAALVLEADARATEGRGGPVDCAACRREDIPAGQAAGPLCLHHLRRHASRLTWEAVQSAASRLLDVAEGRREELPAAMWASPDLADIFDDDDGCPICAVRMAARCRLFEWLADAVQRFPAQAAGSAVALCPTHGWTFHAWSRESGDVVLSQAAEVWARRLSWLVARLDRRPPGRLGVRLAALPTTLSDLMDDEGRLALAEIARATAAAVLRTPTAVLAHLTATALRTEECPVCAAEDDASRQAAASCRVAVCASHLRLVRRAQPDRTTRRAVARATVARLRREAASLRGGTAPAS